MAVMIYNGQEIGGLVNEADKVTYDNKTSGLEATNIQDAVDEVNNNLTNVHNAIDSLNNKTNKYSVEEKAIGEWIDGKPLYKKTSIWTFNKDSANEYPHGITNIDKIWVDLSATFVYNEPDWVSRQPWCAGIVSNFYVDKNSFCFTTSHLPGNICVTFLYTKQ